VEWFVQSQSCSAVDVRVPTAGVLPAALNEEDPIGQARSHPWRLLVVSCRK